MAFNMGRVSVLPTGEEIWRNAYFDMTKNELIPMIELKQRESIANLIYKVACLKNRAAKMDHRKIIAAIEKDDLALALSLLNENDQLKNYLVDNFDIEQIEYIVYINCMALELHFTIDLEKEADQILGIEHDYSNREQHHKWFCSSYRQSVEKMAVFLIGLAQSNFEMDLTVHNEPKVKNIVNIFLDLIQYPGYPQAIARI